jgi:hypothetical protein
MDRTRRRLLSACGTACVALLAGCSSDGSDQPATPTATPPPERASVTDDGTVEYTAMVDGAATVNPDGTDYTIDYTDPEQSFALVSGFEGESNPSELRVSRDLAVDARAAFVAPIYDADAEAFVYAVFANEAFVQYADWHAVNVKADGSISGEGALDFERAEGTVLTADVEPGAVSRLFVVDIDAETFKEGDTGELSGIVVLLFTRSEGTSTPAPTGTPTVTPSSSS